MVSILMVNWNLKKWIDRCVKTILEHPPKVEYEIIFPDNGSLPEDGFREWAREHPQYRYIWNPVNMGYGYALDQGIMVAEGKYICVLNPDTEPAEGWLDYMVEYLEEHPEVGLVGPSVAVTCCPEQRPEVNKGETVDPISNIIPFICVLIPKHILAHHGMFIMTYSEDTEFNVRLRAKKIPTKIVGKAFVRHFSNEGYIANHIERTNVAAKKYHEEVLYPRLFGR
jgi:GT2 family glycosyltransferase